MYVNNTNRIFWIYFIITFFVIIIGTMALINSNDNNMIWIGILWILSNVILLIIVYGIFLHQYDFPKKWDDNSKWKIIFPCHPFMSLINLFFIISLILSTIWVFELSSKNNSLVSSISGIFIIIFGLALTCFTPTICNQYLLSLPFWLSTIYILIWFSLTFYVLNPYKI